MLKDFRTFIGESVWNDIRRQSSGVQLRKEDGVNSLDAESFYGYLVDNYNDQVDSICFDEKRTSTKKCVWVDITPDVTLWVYYSRTTDFITNIMLDWIGVDISEDIISLLEKNYILQEKNAKAKYILEKENKLITNQTFIDVLELLLENKDSLLMEESIWNDIRKQMKKKKM